MKIIYRYGTDMVFSSTDIVADDYQPKSGETFMAVPQGGLMPIKWTGSAWRQATPEEHEAYVKVHQDKHPQQPTSQQQLNAATSLQLAQLMASQKAQDKLNAQFTIDMAQIKAALQKDDNKERAQA